MCRMESGTPPHRRTSRRRLVSTYLTYLTCIRVLKSYSLLFFLTLGITTLILHQSNRLNPYIDWPFAPEIEPNLRAYIEEAHQVNVSVKLYYTLGQLSNHAVELFALLGLNGEILLSNSSDVPPTPGGEGPQLRGMGVDVDDREREAQCAAELVARGRWISRRGFGHRGSHVVVVAVDTIIVHSITIVVAHNAIIMDLVAVVVVAIFRLERVRHRERETLHS